MENLDLSKFIQDAKIAKQKYHNFIHSCQYNKIEFSLTIGDKPSPFAFCFAIFGLHLLKDNIAIKKNKLDWDNLLRSNLSEFKAKRILNKKNLREDKPYLQLLTFTLSALKILGTIETDPLEDHVLPLLDDEIIEFLSKKGTFDGKAQTGNLSMFYAIFLVHAHTNLNVDSMPRIRSWINAHLESLNTNGFWGLDNKMTYLQFQNGYHQYEMFEYFGVSSKYEKVLLKSVASLADNEGHFAPYPGGGGCFDYDAIHILTSTNQKNIIENIDLLLKSFNSIIATQNDNGGFSESQNIRPRNINNIAKSIKHLMNASNSSAAKEMLKYNLTLLRSKHNKIVTHWSDLPRGWSESNLWDSWFRMLTLARVLIAIKPDLIDEWGFIDFPGVGYHAFINNKFKLEL